MGGCVSTPSQTVKPRRRRRHRFKRLHGIIPVPIADAIKKRNSDAGTCVTDYSVSKIVHMEFDNGGTTTRRRSEVSNATFHVTQLQWHHSQPDANGMFFFPCLNSIIFPTFGIDA